MRPWALRKGRSRSRRRVDVAHASYGSQAVPTKGWCSADLEDRRGPDGAGRGPLVLSSRLIGLGRVWTFDIVAGPALTRLLCRFWLQLQQQQLESSIANAHRGQGMHDPPMRPPPPFLIPLIPLEDTSLLQATALKHSPLPCQLSLPFPLALTIAMPANHLRIQECLTAGRPAMGTFMMLPGARLGQVLGDTGLDVGCREAFHELHVFCKIWADWYRPSLWIASMVRCCDAVAVAVDQAFLSPRIFCLAKETTDELQAPRPACLCRRTPSIALRLLFPPIL